jgi:uncharacterized protein
MSRLQLEDIDRRNRLLIDADNVFWGIIKGNNLNRFTLGELISLYKRTKGRCDHQMQEFRFGTDLTAVYIDPTDRCNANCPYCYVPFKRRTQGYSMNEEEVDFILNKVLNYFKQKKTKPVIVFHASEPLLVKKVLFKLINKFKGNFYFGIQTNALLLRKSDVAFIKKHKVSIGISLDAADAITNNKLRYSLQEGGNFKKAVQAIEWFRGYEGLNVITTITRFNVTKLPKLVRFLHKKAVHCVLLNPLRLTQKNSHLLKPDAKTMSNYFIKAIKEALRCSLNSRHKIIVGNFANVILGIIAPRARRLMCDISPCGGGRCFFTITATGEIIPCGEFIGLQGFRAGNIFEDTIEGAMRSRSFKQIRARTVEKISECGLCPLRNICGAPCPAELYALGNMYTKAVFCEFYKDIIRYAFRMIAEGKERYFLRREGLKNLQYQYLL